MNKVEKIKAEIERLKQNNKAFVEFSPYYDGLTDSLDEILSFIDSLEEEPVSEDLEEASKKWLRPLLDKSYANYGEVKMMELTHFDGYAMLDAIEFGAQWQKERDQSTIELAEDHAYLAGQEKVIEKACEWLEGHWREHVWLTDNNIIHFGHWRNDFKKAMEK